MNGVFHTVWPLRMTPCLTLAQAIDRFNFRRSNRLQHSVTTDTDFSEGVCDTPLRNASIANI